MKRATDIVVTYRWCLIRTNSVI